MNKQAVAEAIEAECLGIAQMLLAKNASYGNSFAEPLRIFARGSARDQLYVRIDDKLARLARGSEYPGDDTTLDLIGYLVLARVLKRLQAQGLVPADEGERPKEEP